MGWESDQENTPEPVDNAKRVWYGILIAMVIMFVLLAVTHEDRSYNSRAKVKHILVTAPQGNAELRAAALEKAIDVKRQLDEGADWDKIASLYSDDETNRDNGGVLGWAMREEFVESFDAYLWVGEIGAISDPIETQFGYHLVYIMEREISDAEAYELNLNERVNTINQGGN